MTVAALPSTVSYVEDGATTAFAVPFRFKAAEDLVVERVADGAVIVLRLGVDYRVVGGETDAGGTLTRTEASAGATLRVRRRTARAQEMVYTPDDRFPAKSHEGALDRLMLIAQELDAATGELDARALLVPEGEIGGTLPPAAARAGRALVGMPGGGFTTATLGDGDDPTLRSDLAAADGATRVGFAPQAPGTAPRSVQAKLRERVSISDFKRPAEPDYAPALARALATNKEVFFPAGDYPVATGPDWAAIKAAHGVEIPVVQLSGEGRGRSRILFTGAGTFLKGGRTVTPAGYAQSLVADGLSLIGTGVRGNSLALKYGEFTTSANNSFAGCDSATERFDAGVNLGPARVAGFLQRALNLLNAGALSAGSWRP
ncbi:hypothetical protein [Sphingomonas sp. BK235]|uniref:hypothetical protein n=1 Tax=Sphingomonas sp. BK235 TaxID=2512131 RepID=UPI00104A02EB|nr:hypothetical protein [Sphingomonas sp. BK235]TCP35922.1 hypothetical protein EV292_102512 [Sphingomonas sp. BK235]